MSTPIPRDMGADLALPASLESLAVARSALQQALADRGWDVEAARPVVLATGEAVANAIVHGSPPDASVVLGLAVTADLARVRVVDEGREGIRPPQCPTEPPPVACTSGRGLYIMRAVADSVLLRCDGRGTEVVLEFRRAA